MAEAEELTFDMEPAMSGLLAKGSLRVKIIGVGGAGANAVDRLKLDNLEQLDIAVVNTDSQALESSPIEEKILLGRSITRGLSAGGEAAVGRQAAEADKELLRKMVSGTNLVFLLSGLGGGTGSGAAPVIAKLASEAGATVMAFVTTPFSREGSRRAKQAECALKELKGSCDAVIGLPNDILLQQVSEDATVMEAFAIADQWINQGVRSIVSMIFETGLINVDFATLKGALQSGSGKTLFGTGFAKGESYVESAIEDLEKCPLLHLPENRSIKSADSLIVNISGGPDLTMARVNRVMEYVSEKFGCKDSIVLGATIDGGLSGSLRITVLGKSEHERRTRQFAPVPAASQPAPESSRSVKQATDKSKARKVVQSALDTEQSEFSFNSEDSQRGLFERTSENLYEGEDLDVPTYLRRGLKIALS